MCQPRLTTSEAKMAIFECDQCAQGNRPNVTLYDEDYPLNPHSYEASHEVGDGCVICDAQEIHIAATIRYKKMCR